MKSFLYMIRLKYNLALCFTAFLPFLQLQAQIITPWDQNRLPQNEAHGVISYIDETDMSEQAMFQDWNNTLSAFSDIKEITDEDIRNEIKSNGSITEKIRQVFLNGRQLNLPSNIDENGVDLYMLTDEGISIYMAMLAPAFYQETTPDIIKWIRYYACNRHSYTQRMFERYETWQERISESFRSKGVPEEIAELCLIESGCTYSALSKAGALGMWQIMPATGRDWGMTVTKDTDDRLNPILSTEIAGKILADNYRKTGDWTLAIAAYNCGAGRIQKKRQSLGTNEWLKMKESLPKETQQYIPALLAIHYIWKYKERLGF